MSRLSGWKSKFLSLAGRATLIQAVTAAIPIYSMQSNWLPEFVCSNLNQINRKFLWSNDVQKHKLHLVGWDKVTLPKAKGGLGLRSARETNEALLSKLAWKVLRNENTIWSELIRAKYLKGKSLLHCKEKPSDSATWKGIVRCVNIIKPFFRWRIGNGNTVSFWFDNWLGSGAIWTKGVHIIPTETTLKLDDMMNEVGAWAFEDIQSTIPPQVRAEIENSHIQLNDEPDLVLWSETANGNFTYQSAYRDIQTHYGKHVNISEKGDWIWKTPFSNKLRHFLWLANQERLATNLLRKIRKITEDGTCSLCNTQEESVIHMLRNCASAIRIWKEIIPPSRMDDFLKSPANCCLKSNCCSADFVWEAAPHIPWKFIFIAGIWFIWKSRNHAIFKGSQETVNSILFQVRQLSHELQTCLSKKEISDKETRWVKPKEGWVKLNSDGSLIPSRNKGGVGGVLRDETGKWLWGYSEQSHASTPLLAELQAMKRGLEIAWDKRYEKIEIETDCLEAYKLIQGNSIVSENAGIRSMVDDCKRLLQMPWLAKVGWTYRKSNLVADKLAKLASSGVVGNILWDSPSSQVVPFFNFDNV